MQFGNSRNFVFVAVGRGWDVGFGAEEPEMKQKKTGADGGSTTIKEWQFLLPLRW
jgi:hypothetical protein